MSQFMLVLYDDPSSFQDLSAEQKQEVVRDYSSWAETMGAEGKVVGGNKLTNEGGRILRRDDGGVQVTDGPYSESKEVLAGYFLVEAADYAEAVEIARSCPHLKYERHIDVRRLDIDGCGA